MQAQPGFLQHQQQAEEHGKSEGDDVEAVKGQGEHRIDLPGAAHPLRRDHRAVQWRENHSHGLLQDQADAESGEQRFQWASVEIADHEAFDQDADKNRRSETPPVWPQAGTTHGPGEKPAAPRRWCRHRA